MSDWRSDLKAIDNWLRDREDTRPDTRDKSRFSHERKLANAVNEEKRRKAYARLFRWRQRHREKWLERHRNEMMQSRAARKDAERDFGDMQTA